MMTNKKKVFAPLLASVIALAITGQAVLSASADYRIVVSENGKYYTDYNTLEEAKEAAADLAIDVASEGNTLLKNKENALPMAGTEYVSVFGVASDNLASYASGYSLIDALEDEGFKTNKALRNFYAKDSSSHGTENLGFTRTVEQSYQLYNDVAIVVIGRTGGEGADMLTITKEKANDAKENVGGWEHKDLYNDGTDSYKHFLQMTDSEVALLNYVKEQGFKKIVYLINSSEIMELYNIENDDAVDGILWVGRPGQDGIKAAAKILTGKVNPSGKTVDTWYKDFTADPTWQNFGTNKQNGTTHVYSYKDKETGKIVVTGSPEILEGWAGFNGAEGYFGIDYEEDIYVGYRYYETRAYEANKEGSTDTFDYDDAVVYPFGYGLSYTSYSYSDIKVVLDNGTEVKEGDVVDADLFSSTVDKKAVVEKATAYVTVTNEGNVAGKESVQLYVTAPYTYGEVEKSYVTLVAFGKTELLQPGQSQTLAIEFNIQDMASYDAKDLNKNDNKGYELDEGAYTIRAMANAHGWANTAAADYEEVNFTLDADAIQKLDDFSGNVVENLFSVENGMFYTLRDNVNSKYQFNADTTANMTQMSRSGFAGTFPVAPTAADQEMTQGMFESLRYWDTFKVDDTANYADGKVVQGWNGTKMVNYVDADDYPWMAEVTANAEKIATWDQTGTYGIQLSEMSGINPFDTETVITAEGRFKGMTHAAAWDTFMNTLAWSDLQNLVGKLQKQSMASIGMNALMGQDSAWNYARTYCFTCNCTLAATWNAELAEKQGIMIGNLALLSGNNTWWGGSVQTHRSPFGGRVFEYFSEDGILSGYIGAAEIRGANSKGLVTFMKHCALNDQETSRNGYNLMAWVSEQAIREIYYKSFQMAAQEGQSSGEMGAFARAGRSSINVNYNITTKLFKEQWGCKTLSHTTDNYDGMKMCTALDLLVRAGTDNISTSDMSGTWNSEGKYVTIGEGEAAVRSDVQWYTTRKCAMVFLYAHANTAMNKNGITTTAWETKTLEATQGVAVSGQSVAFDVDADTVDYTVSAGNLPAGITLKADGSLSGTATEAGVYEFTVKLAADNWITATKKFTLNVTSCFEIDETKGKVGEEFYAGISSDVVKVASNSTVEYSVLNGALPAGITLNANGELEGTPTEAGTYNVTLLVKNTVKTGSGRRQQTTIYNYAYEITLTIAEDDVVPEVPTKDIVSVEEIEGGNRINFSDGTYIDVMDGKDGENGAPGKDGVDGKDGVAGATGCSGSITGTASLAALAALVAVGGAMIIRRKED